jgi:hypothetical protein
MRLTTQLVTRDEGPLHARRLDWPRGSIVEGRAREEMP